MSSEEMRQQKSTHEEGACLCPIVRVKRLASLEKGIHRHGDNDTACSEKRCLG